MSKKFTFEYVKQYFDEQGCELLEKEYKGVHILMKYICKCGKESKISFNNFKRGQRCKKCGIEKNVSKRKHSFEYVYNYFKNNECELLEEEYVNNSIKMKYICRCGKISLISFNNFKSGRRCKKCGVEKMSESQKFTFEYVYNYFKEQGCKLLETKYTNIVTKMSYICNCKNINKITFNDFKSGRRCKKCGVKKLSENKKFTFEYVYNYFKEQGCKLLETKYINSFIKIKYICICGRVHRINFVKFKQGQRCNKCAKKRRKKTMIKKYGSPYFSNGSGYSKESQKLFDSIYKRLSKDYKRKIYYATLNREFGINYKNKWFNYDYVDSKSKKAIEYNGRVFHPVPRLKDFDVKWHAIDKTKTAGEARAYEKIKYEGLEKRGYKILTVWDYEVKNSQDFNILVQKCLDFLTS